MTHWRDPLKKPHCVACYLLENIRRDMAKPGASQTIGIVIPPHSCGIPPRNTLTTSTVR